ncbi:hypothetical protein PRIC2_011558 [Phytophthora ramorum]
MAKEWTPGSPLLPRPQSPQRLTPLTKPPSPLLMRLPPRRRQLMRPLPPTMRHVKEAPSRAGEGQGFRGEDPGEETKGASEEGSGERQEGSNDGEEGGGDWEEDAPHDRQVAH